MRLASDSPAPKTKKPAAGGGAAGFSKTRTTAGRRNAIVHKTTLGRRIGTSQFEALPEEVHHFDEDQDTRFCRILNRLYRSVAMQETQGLICKRGWIGHQHQSGFKMNAFFGIRALELISSILLEKGVG